MRNSILPDETEDQLLLVLNSIFKYFITKNILSLDELTNEFKLREVLLSIEPNLEKSLIELTKDDEYGIRYGNFVSIMNALSEYFSSHIERNNFTSFVNFKSRLNISELMKYSKKQEIMICEMILFVSSISSKKDFVDLLESCSEQIISTYLSITEKYTKKYDDNTNTPNEVKYSYMDDDYRSSIVRHRHDSSNKANEDLARELDDKISELNSLQKMYNDLDSRYKDSLNNLNKLQKDNNNDNTLLQDDLITQKTANIELMTEINELKMQNADQKKESNDKIKTLNFKVSNLNEKLLAYESKVENAKALVAENEKLKEKLKMNKIEEKEEIIAEKMKIIDGKSRIIELLSKDKENLNERILELQKDILGYKDQLRDANKTKNDLGLIIEELKKENYRLDMIMKSDENSSFRRKSSVSPFAGESLTQLGISSTEGDIEDLNKIIDQKDIEIHTVKSRLSTFEKELIVLKEEQQKWAGSKDSLFFEKEIIADNLQKERLARQKDEQEYENQLSLLQAEINTLKQAPLKKPQNNTTELDKTEIMTLKSEISKKNDLIEALQKKINSAESDAHAFLSHYQDPDVDPVKIGEELEQSKRSYNDLKQRVNKEYELISSSFYELAIQFMNLKVEVKEKTKNIPPNKSWIETERTKNFPNA